MQLLTKYVIRISFEFRKAVQTGVLFWTQINSGSFTLVYLWHLLCLIVMDMTLGLIISYRVSVEMLWQWLRILWWSDNLSIQSICRWTGSRQDRTIPPGSENCSFSIQASLLLTHTWVDICSFKNICNGHLKKIFFTESYNCMVFSFLDIPWAFIAIISFSVRQSVGP